MTIIKTGSALPNDTEVYIYAENNQKLLARKESVSRYPYLLFIFDPNDGLWASINVREYWDYHPQKHPCITLFGILYKKLEV
jgi:hypothetical protein